MGIDLRRLDPRRRSAARRARTLHKAGGFYPTQLSAVGAWLRLAQGTVTGSGYSSIPDVLGGSPATQSDNPHRPVNGTSANALPIMTCSDSILSMPLGAGNNGTTKWGFACWIKQTNSASCCLCTIELSSGATANKILILLINTGLTLRCDEMVTDRHATSDAQVLNTWQFITVEVDCSQATEATKVLHSVGGVLQTVNFSSGTPWPSSLASVTGTLYLAGRNIGFPSNNYQGIYGPNIYFLTRQLTSAERVALMNFEAPT